MFTGFQVVCFGVAFSIIGYAIGYVVHNQKEIDYDDFDEMPTKPLAKAPKFYKK